MGKKLTERDIFNHLFNKKKLSKASLELIEKDPNYKELKEYYEYLKKEISSYNKDDISLLAEKIRRKNRTK